MVPATKKVLIIYAMFDYSKTTGKNELRRRINFRIRFCVFEDNKKVPQSHLRFFF
jgi:hypothetical protein